MIATVALFVALGGSSYAALKLPKNSVGAKQIKKNAVGAKQIKKNAVTSAKVKPGSLLTSDFRASQRSALRGPQGAPGPQGPQGLAGAPGSARAYAPVIADNGADPLFAAGAHPGFTGVTRTSVGVYCLTAPGLSLEQRASALVSAHNVGAGYFVGATLCADGVEVWTRDNTNTLANYIDFNVLIP